VKEGRTVRQPPHARLIKVLGAVGPPAALLCIGYAAFARWPQAIAPEATRGGTPLTAHERTVGRTMAAELPALPTGAGRLGRESRLLDDPGSTAGEIPRSPTVHLNPPPLGRPAIESAPYPGEALASAGDQEALSEEGFSQAREREPFSRGLVLVTGGTYATEDQAVPADLPAPAPPTSRPMAGGGAKGSSLRIPRSNTRVWMAPRVANVRVGDRIAVQVEIAQAVDVGSVPFHILFNPAVLRFEGAEEGAFLKGAGLETVFLAAPAAAGNEVVVGLARLRRGEGNDGAGELCVLNFTVIGQGEAGLAFSRARVVDLRSQVVPSRFEAASITSH